jgi:hypothetical protein
MSVCNGVGYDAFVGVTRIEKRAEEFGITRDPIRQIEAKALRTLPAAARPL